MSNLLLGVVAGLLFGAASVAMMLPMSFPDKSTALSAAFVDRFAIGVVIACVQLAWPGWATGLAFGLLLSLPSAIITKAYVPILVIGAIGGLIIGGVIHGWLPRA
jgi:hypothetical protein